MPYIYFKPDRIWQVSSINKYGLYPARYVYFDDNGRRTVGLGLNASEWQPVAEWRIKHKNKFQILISIIKRWIK
jgi:hypothetical protein